MAQHELGQYFTTNSSLQEKLVSFIHTNPSLILEPSIGQGDLVVAVHKKNPDILFDMYEIDDTIPLLPGIDQADVYFDDFMTSPITTTYQCIIGNPPYVKLKGSNLYIDFTEKCFTLLAQGGELIFIVPTAFLKKTSSCKLLNRMMTEGTFTHIYHPHNEKLFEGASIDVIVYRYCKDKLLPKQTLYNDKLLYITNSSGLITFSDNDVSETSSLLSTHFDIYVGMVSGKESVFKHPEIGNIEVLNGKDQVDKYIMIDKFPSGNQAIDEWLTTHKSELLSRAIRRFSEANWFEWGAPRNKEKVKASYGRDCIYIKTLTRQTEVAFVGKVMNVGGGLLILIPRKECDLGRVVEFLNSDGFKANFLFAGRFKIGHRQLANSMVPNGMMMMV